MERSCCRYRFPRLPHLTEGFKLFTFNLLNLNHGRHEPNNAGS
jgi:hypothetical protein